MRKLPQSRMEWILPCAIVVLARRGWGETDSKHCKARDRGLAVDQAPFIRCRGSSSCTFQSDHGPPSQGLDEVFGTKSI